MRALFCCAFLALLPIQSAVAQETTDPPPSEAIPQAAQERFDELEAEFGEATRAYRKAAMERRKATEAGEEPEGPAPEWPGPAFLEKFQKAAEEFAGTEGAVPFLVWVANGPMTIGNDEATTRASSRALATLVEHHVSSPGLEDLTRVLPYLSRFLDDEEATSVLTALEAGAVPPVRAWAVWSRISDAVSNAERGSDEYAKAKAEAEGLLADADDRLKSTIETEIGIREKFSLGMVAPDISGIDLDGVAFKLSDYKGKIIFLDFWGDW